MARKPRVHYAGAIYHVIARGNNREVIFRDPVDKQRYLELLHKYIQRYICDIFAYVLMDNHLHMMLRIEQTPLAKVMQGIQLSYTQYFNRRYEHVGHVFQQRYKAFLCADDAYLLQLLSYIHQNPVRAEMEDGLNYRWSSHQAYCKGRHPFVKVDYILGILAEDHQTAIKQYIEFMRKEQKSLEIPIVSAVSSVDGGKQEISCQNKLLVNHPCVSWEEMVDKVVANTGVDKQQLVGKCRVHEVVAARNQLIYDVINSSMMHRAELAQRLQIDPARISKGYQQVEQLMLNKSISQA